MTSVGIATSPVTGKLSWEAVFEWRIFLLQVRKSDFCGFSCVSLLAEV